MNSILTPVLALIVLTLLVWIWMYATRLPAMQRAKIDPQDAAHPGSLDILPSSARRVTDNYNHLLEQPVIFYAMVFYIYLTGHQDQLHIWLAWTYVGFRVLHTLVQCTINRVTLRFTLFSLATFALMAMAVREVMAL